MKKSRIYEMVLIAVMTAVTCVLAPISLVIPVSPVPISLAMLAIFVSVYVLDMKRATVSYALYLLLGLVGVPVFSGFSSGPAKLFGPTGGYLIGFVFLVIICGYFIDRWTSKIYMCVLGMVLGTIVCYAFGTAWLAYVAHMDFGAALMAGVIPFLPGDAAKIIIAILVGPQLRKALNKAHLREVSAAAE